MEDDDCLTATASDHKRCIKARALGSCRSNFPASQDARATEVRKRPILIVRIRAGLLYLWSRPCTCKCTLGWAAVTAWKYRHSGLGGARFNSFRDYKVVTSGFKRVMSCHPNTSWRWRPGRFTIRYYQRLASLV